MPERDDTTRVEQLPESETGPVPVSVSRAEPRLFGVTPPSLLAAVALVLLSAGVALAVTGSLVAGLVLVALGLAFAGLFAEAVQRQPADPLARLVDGQLREAGAFAGFAGRSLSAWWRARRELRGIRRGLRALAGEHRDGLLALGEASYADDGDEVARRRESIRRLDERASELQARAAEVVAAYHRKVAGEKLAVQPTEQLELVDPPQS
jgi:signal transduction histidine kinase